VGLNHPLNAFIKKSPLSGRPTGITRDEKPASATSGRYHDERNAVLIRWLKFPWVRSVLALTLLVVPAVPGHAKDRDKDRSRPNQHRKLDKVLNRRAAEGGGTSRVIVVFNAGSAGTDARSAPEWHFSPARPLPCAGGPGHGYP